MTTLRLEPHPHGVLLPVRAQPGARRSALVGVQDGALKVAVTAAPEKGKANRAIVALLAKSLRLKKSQFELESGETARQKRFLVRDVALDEFSQRVAAALNVGDD